MSFKKYLKRARSVQNSSLHGKKSGKRLPGPPPKTKSRVHRSRSPPSSSSKKGREYGPGIHETGENVVIVFEDSENGLPSNVLSARLRVLDPDLHVEVQHTGVWNDGRTRSIIRIRKDSTFRKLMSDPALKRKYELTLDFGENLREEAKRYSDRVAPSIDRRLSSINKIKSEKTRDRKITEFVRDRTRKDWNLEKVNNRYRNVIQSYEKKLQEYTMSPYFSKFSENNSP